jgi:hypothetical protein
MFVLVTVLGIWLGWQARIVHERRAIFEEIGRSGHLWGGQALEEDELDRPGFALLNGLDHGRISWIRRLMGDRTYWSLYFNHRLDPELLDRLEKAFP